MKPHLMLGASAIAVFAMIGPALASVETGTITSMDQVEQTLTLNDGTTFKIITLLHLRNYEVGEKVAITWYEHEHGLPVAYSIKVLPTESAPMHNMLKGG